VDVLVSYVATVNAPVLALDGVIFHFCAAAPL